MLNMQTLEQNDDLVSPRISFRRSGPLMCPNPSMCSLSRKSFSYNKLPPRPLTLTVIKLDGSSFVIEVPKSGTVAQLKQGVEKAFSHLPKKGPGTVSWPHVWGHFCLCYQGQKLLTHSDTIGCYGIQDGDQLHFVRYVSISYNMVKDKQQQEEDEENPDLDKLIILDSCKGGQDNKEKDADNPNERDIENQTEKNGNNGEAEQRLTNKLANLFGRWFSYHKLASSDIRIEEKGCSPRLSLNSLGSSRNGQQVSVD